MPRLVVFNQVTLDGYFAGPNGDISWAHSARNTQDQEWSAFVAENAKGGGPLLFGRITYQLMEKYWPTPQARKDAPEVAEHMNSLPKIVFSRTLDTVSWNNTRLVKNDVPVEIQKLKNEPGRDLTILGNGRLVSQLTREGLIDEYMVVVNPVILGKGRTMFEGVKDKLSMKLSKTRAFKNGNVLLIYESAA